MEINKYIIRIKVTIISVLLFPLALTAQDVLITKGGDIHTVYGIEVSSSSVFYQLENTANAPIQRIEKNEIFMIKHPDGTKTLFNNENKNNKVLKLDSLKTFEVQIPPISLTTNDQQKSILSHLKNSKHSTSELKDIKTLNEEYINRFNNPEVSYLYPNKENKKASAVYCRFAIKKDATFIDENITINYITGGYQYDRENKTFEFRTENRSLGNQALAVGITNKTDKIIYIDLANTFILRLGQAEAYYIPSANYQTTGNTKEVGVNVGGIANAIGIKGVAGAIAQSINVGASKNNSSTDVTYSQRIISIPPKSFKYLDHKLFFTEENTYGFILEEYNKLEKCALINYYMINGEKKTWNEENASIHFDTYITYSLAPDFSQCNNIRAGIYLKEMIAVPGEKGIYNKLIIKRNSLSPNFKKMLYFLAKINQ